MKRQKKLRLSGSLCRVFRLPCVKGAPPQAVRDCFFYNTPTAARFPNPSRRGLQVCFAHSQIPPTAARFPNPSRRGLFELIPQPHRFSSIFSLISSLKKARLSGGLFVSLFCVCCGFFNRRFFGSFCGFL